MLHYLFAYFEDLLSVNGIAYTCYQEAFTVCYQQHSHPEDYYTNLEPDKGESDYKDNKDTDDVKADPEIEVLLADFEAYA